MIVEFFLVYFVCLNNLLDYIVFNYQCIRDLNNQKNEEENMFMNKKFFLKFRFILF